MLGLFDERPPRLRVTDEVGSRQRDRRGFAARFLGSLGARGVQATQQTVDGEGVGSHEGRGQEALGEFAALGHVRVARPRRHGHQVQEQARRRLGREVEGTSAARDGHASARQVAAGFGNHRGAAHDNDLIRKVDAVVQVVGPEGSRDEGPHLRGRGAQVGDQSALRSVVRDAGLAPGGRSGLCDARACLARQLPHGAGHVVDLAQLSYLDTKSTGKPAVQVRLTATIPSHGHIGIREGDDPGTRVAAGLQQPQRRRRAILQVIDDHHVGHRGRRLHAARGRVLLPRVDQIGRERLDTRQVYAQGARILRGTLGPLLQRSNNRARALPLRTTEPGPGLGQLSRVHPGLSRAGHQVAQLPAEGRHRAHLRSNVLGPRCIHRLQGLGEHLVLGRARHQLHALQGHVALGAPRSHHLIGERGRGTHRAHRIRAKRLRARGQHVGTRAIGSENQRGAALGVRLLEHGQGTRRAARGRGAARNHVARARRVHDRTLVRVQLRQTPPIGIAATQPDLDFAHNAILPDPTRICGTYDGHDDIYQQGVNMEIFIGIRDNTRQLALDVDMTENELMAKVNEALISAHGVLDITDTKGQRTLVPAHALGYVQIANKTERRVGFAIH